MSFTHEGSLLHLIYKELDSGRVHNRPPLFLADGGEYRFVRLNCSSIRGVHLRESVSLRLGTLERGSKGEVSFHGKFGGQVRFWGEARREGAACHNSGSQGVLRRQRDSTCQLKVLRERSGRAGRVKEDMVRPVRGRGDHCNVQDVPTSCCVNGLLGVHLGDLFLGVGHSLSLPADARGRGVKCYKLLRDLTCLFRRTLRKRSISRKGSDSLNSYPKEAASCLRELLNRR
jgi:hypothetical protein